MPLLQWESLYSVGNEVLDGDHQGLFADLNELWRQIEQQAEAVDLLTALAQVQLSMEAHFTREEDVLRRLNYPLTDRHAREHRGFLGKLTALGDRIRHGQLDRTDGRAMDFIGTWLCDHILHSDADYARYFKDHEETDALVEATSKASPRAMASLKPKRVWPRLRPAIVIGLAVSGMIGWLVLSLERSTSGARFTELAEQRINSVRINLNAALDTLSNLSDTFAVSKPESISRGDFQRLATPIIARHPFIQALEWIPRLPLAAKDRYESMARRDGLGDFRLTERDGAGNLVPVGERGEFFPVFYVEPVASNLKALGFDLASNAVRRQALEAARDLGQLVVTGRIVLVQEKGDQFGALIFAPVFPDRPASREERRQSLAGYVLGVFRLGNFIETADPLGKKSVLDEMVDIRLYDLSAPADSRQLYPSKPEIPPESLTSGLYTAVTMEVAGRTWQVIATPTAAFRRTTVPLNAIAAVLAGLSMTAFIVYRRRNEIDRGESSARFARVIARTKQRLSEAHRIARLSFMEWDPASGLWLLGEGLAELLDIEPSRMSGDLDTIFAHADAEGRQRVKDALSLPGSGNFSLELKVGDKVVQVVGDATAAGLLTFQDVTQRHLAEKERAALMSRMAEAGRLESLGTLAGGVAHEINTPAQFISDNLAFIKDWLPRLLGLAGASRAAADSGDWTAVAEQARSMKYDFAARELPLAAEQGLAGIARISNIVQAIKEFSYPSGKTPQPFNLNHAVEVAGTVTRNQWKYVAELHLDLAPDLPPLNGIEGEINQILVNLILNAAQAIEEKGGGALGSIDIQTRADGDSIELLVADSGTGIAAENRDRLFELFFTTKPPGKGTGQGLAITKAIVLRHGGTISVDSEPGTGARFRITLPASGPPLAAADPT